MLLCLNLRYFRSLRLKLSQEARIANIVRGMYTLLSFVEFKFRQYSCFVKLIWTPWFLCTFALWHHIGQAKSYKASTMIVTINARINYTPLLIFENKSESCCCWYYIILYYIRRNLVYKKYIKKGTFKLPISTI